MKEIIDWDNKGNVVRFYLGKNGEQWGDDWNDTPYECNAGMVYSAFVEYYVDVAFPFSVDVWFAENDYSKEQFIKREVPFMIVVKEQDDYSMFEFSDYVRNGFKNCETYYFGDVFDEDRGGFVVVKGIAAK
jgi:hypothetical protein